MHQPVQLEMGSHQNEYSEKNVLVNNEASENYATMSPPGNISTEGSKDTSEAEPAPRQDRKNLVAARVMDQRKASLTLDLSNCAQPSKGDQLGSPDSDGDILAVLDRTPDALDEGPHSGHRSVSFSHVFEPLYFSDLMPHVYIPNQPITLRIIDMDVLPSTLNFFNQCVFTISLQHGSTSWIITRKSRQIFQLHNQLKLFKTILRLPAATSEAREKRQSMRHMIKRSFTEDHDGDCVNSRRLVKFPRKSLQRMDNFTVGHVELYLSNLLRHSLLKSHSAVLEFFEISPISFVSHLGPKLEEGFVKKRSGGRKALMCCGGRYKRRWLVLRESCIFVITPGSGTVRTVMLIDSGFQVSHGFRHTRVSKGLLITNLSRSLVLKCDGDKSEIEWSSAIEKARNEFAADFAKPNRHLSFAPIRKESYARWYVDGSWFMSDVADLLEYAREEIYITDWWLSPDIYLKRPDLTGSWWKLSEVLKRQANRGVKVFILLYKEVELALGLNSLYTKQNLSQMHFNIKVLRHPDHHKGSLYWAHHEKMVVVDQMYAFVGGIDLCYGRWDDHRHKLVDVGHAGLKVQKAPESALGRLIINTSGILTEGSSTQSLEETKSEDLPISNNLNIEQRNISYSNGDIGTGLGLDSAIQKTEDEELIVDVVDRAHDKVCDSVPNDHTLDDKVVIPGFSDLQVDPTSNKSRPVDHLTSSDVSPVVDDINDAKEITGVEVSTSANNLKYVDISPIANENIDLSTCDSNAKTESYQSATTIEMNSIDHTKSVPDEIPSAFPPNPSIVISYSETTEIDSVRNHSCDSFETVTAVVSDSSPTKDTSNDEEFTSDFSPLENSPQHLSPQVDEENDSNYTRKYKEFDRKEKSIQAKMSKNLKTVKNLGLDLVGEMKERKKIMQNSVRLKRAPSINSEFGFSSDTDEEDDDTYTTQGKTFRLHRRLRRHIRPRNQARKTSRAASTGSLIELHKELTHTDATSVHLWVGKDYVNWITKDLYDPQIPFNDIVNRNQTPRMPWHDIAMYVEGPAARDAARHFIERWNAVKSEKVKNNERYPYLIPKSYRLSSFVPSVLSFKHRVKCQVVRSLGNWSGGLSATERSIYNAYLDAIKSSKYFIYIENQFFITSSSLCGSEITNSIAYHLYERIFRAHRNNEAFRVYVVLPLLPAFEGQIGTPSGVAMQYILHYTYLSIIRGPNSLIGLLTQAGIKWQQYLSFTSLRSHDILEDHPVTELIYIHSKLIIVDDRLVIAGSANINDRSLLGNRDSEVDLVIEDEEYTRGVMNGKPFKRGKFAGSLRIYLFGEHLGVSGDTEINIEDPVAEKFFVGIWQGVAAKNSKIFDEVFNCIPSDAATTFAELKRLRSENSFAKLFPEKAKEKLKKLQGRLVSYPLKFLEDEVVKPGPTNKEFLLPVEMWI